MICARRAIRASRSTAHDDVVAPHSKACVTCHALRCRSADCRPPHAGVTTSSRRSSSSRRRGTSSADEMTPSQPASSARRAPIAPDPDAHSKRDHQIAAIEAVSTVTARIFTSPLRPGASMMDCYHAPSKADAAIAQCPHRGGHGGGCRKTSGRRRSCARARQPVQQFEILPLMKSSSPIL